MINKNTSIQLIQYIYIVRLYRIPTLYQAQARWLDYKDT